MPATAASLLIFFVSGACGLAYEVIWTRLLGLAIGHTTVALTAVVAAYMGGLAIGSARAGRLLRRGIPPAAFYAGLEVGIALLALSFPLQLSVVTSLSAQSGQWLERGSVALGLTRFLLASLAVVPATVLMGATLPAMLEAVPRRAASRPPAGADGARRAAMLYGVNTAGAVVGAALAGFVGIERLGTLETTWVAAGGNVMAGALAWVVLRRATAEQFPVERDSRQVIATAPVPAGSARRTSPGGGPWPVLLAYGLSGSAALTLQIVWTRALVFYAGSTTYAFTSILIVFLGGVAIGSALIAPWVERLRSASTAFLWTQALLAVAAAASLRVLRAASPAVDAVWPPEASWASLVAGNFAKGAAAMAGPALLMGALFPIAVRLARECSDTTSAGPGDEGARLGQLYAANTVGAVVGAALSGLLLLPVLGMRVTLLGACLVALVAACSAWWFRSDRRSTSSLGHGGLIVAGVGTLCAGLALGGGPLHVPAGSEQLVFYEEGAAGTVSVLTEVTGTRTLYIDRVPVAGTDSLMLTDQKSLAHVPMLLHGAARQVLTVGFGSGGASWSFTRYKALERVDAVEIDPTVFRAAPFLQDSNHGVWQDPRFHLVLEDARNYLASTGTRYDIISTDCTDLRYKTNANLYTVDYFTLVRDRLNPGGIVTVWMPLGGLGGDTFRMALRTFRRVFPHTTIWYMTNQPTHYLLLVGTDVPLRPDPAAIRSGLREQEVLSDLAEIRLDDPLKLAASLLADEDEVARFVGDGPVNTDRHPLLEFQAPRLAYRDALATNLRAVAAARDRSAGLRRWSGDPAARTDLAPYVAATPPLVEGHARYQLGTFDYEGALQLYRAAAVLNPADRSVTTLIRDVEHTRDVWLAEFGARTGDGGLDVRDWLAHAALLRQAGRLDEALTAARRATELAPGMAEPWLRLAAVQSQRGDVQAAIATLERARTLAPRDPMVLADLGAALNEAGSFAAAEAVLRESLALRATADAYNNLGVALNGLGRPSDAVGQFGAALALNSASAEAWFNLGVAQAMLGDVTQARTAYQRGLALMPGEPRALENLALVEALAGRLDLAVRYVTEALVRAPGSAALHNTLGRAYLGLGRVDEAIAAFEQALAIDPASPEIRENLALARESRGPRVSAAVGGPPPGR